MNKVSPVSSRREIDFADATAVAWDGKRARTNRTSDHDPAIIQLYYTIEALKPENRHVVLQFMAALPGEGTTTIAAGFAAVASDEMSRKVLLIDCNPPADGKAAAMTLLDAHRQQRPLDQILARSERYDNLRTVRMSASAHPLMEIEGEELARLLEALRGDFSMIVLDCAAAAATPDSIALSRYCDGTVIVVRAEYARPAVIRAMQQQISLVGGEIVGVVFNRRRTYIPKWLYSRLFPGIAAS